MVCLCWIWKKVSECKSDDWMDGLIEELREKTEH